MKFNLTSEEQQYLRATTRYLKSLGMDSGSLEFEMEDSIIPDINWKWHDSFSNNHSIEIPTKIREIFDRIVNYIDSEDLVESISSDYDVNYERLEIKIDCDDEKILVRHWYSYLEDGSAEGLEWDINEDENLKQIFDTLENDLDKNPPKNGVLRLDYNGSGDSGYIEDYFDNGSSVPADVENWCYGQLESHYGGWEINEGSRGYFEFNLNTHTVELSHTQTYEESDSDDVLEISFKK